jgi:hypothetical protein
MNKITNFALAAVVAGFAGISGAQVSTLDGATVDVDFFFPNSTSLYCSSGTAVVGAGGEYANGCSGFGAVSIDVTDTQVIVGHSNTGGFASGLFNGFVMSILSGPTILSAAYNAGASTLGSTSLSFTGSSISFNFASQGAGTAVFDINSSSVSAVPLPAAGFLLLGALGGLGAMRRRKKA